MFVVLQSSSVLLQKCCSLLARVEVARCGLAKVNSHWHVVVCWIFPKGCQSWQRYFTCCQVISTNTKSRQGGKLSLQPVVAHIAAPAVLPLLDQRLKPQCGASQSSVDSSHQQLTGIQGLSRSWWRRICLCVILLWIMTSSRLGKETWAASVRQSRCSTQPHEPLLPVPLSE